MSRRSKHISLGRIWLKPRCLGRAGRNVSRLVELGRNLEALVALVKTYLAWSKHRCFFSRRWKRISLDWNWSKPRFYMSRRSKHISLGRIWLKPRCLGRAGRNVSRLVEPGRNLEASVALVKTYLAWSKHRCFVRAGGNVSRWIELGRYLDFTSRAGRNISRLVALGQNLDVLVAPVKTYLAWSRFVET